MKAESSSVEADVLLSFVGFDQTNIKVTQKTEKIERPRDDLMTN